MKRKSLTQWVIENRAEIDQYIRRVCPNARLDDSERRLWVLNDESLYLWAKSARVKI